jgi:hypothetical protein
METDVVCPECGKVIAPEGAVDNSLRCQCSEARTPKVSIDSVPLRPQISVPIPDVVPLDLPEQDFASSSATATTEKTCFQCGISLHKKVRLKDHLGRYWCKKCASADVKKKRQEDRHRCADCSRVFPPNKLQYFQTDRVCATCFKAREEALEKKIIKAEIHKTYKRHELSRLAWMGIIVVVLIVIATIFQLMR